ncbi:class I SAM-dependent methyltransferase [Ancylobacter lacus]|nr:cyclopropane-fatty-acyl-phospholipid synthase family protein [Ancylobacter lacus]MBS7539502.1 class I SAM-dependent methyltransferase [Ancylobacter lacus]
MNSNSTGPMADSAFPGHARRSRIGEAMLQRVLSSIEIGRLTVVTPGGQRLTRRGALAGPEATLELHRWRALRRLISAGDIGFARAYADGDWSSPDLAALLELAAHNVPHVEKALGALLPVRVWNRLRHGVRGNSRRGSRRNIAFHYDLGNEFYRLWLDAGMSYSSALYSRPGQSLEEAQEAKLDRAVELLELKGGESVLEIGCGWGALAAAIARRGATVTGLTLSREQLAWAQAMLAAESLTGRVRLRYEDYRDTTGQFDRIVSVEMIEAVGERYWPTYFRTLRDRLKAGGTAVLQVITIAEDRFEGYRRNTDFIQQFIFPGGMLPTRTILAEQARRAGLELADSQCFGESYARTLHEWRRRFLLTWPQASRLGFPDEFRRLWEYYFCYCEGGFRAGAIDVGFYTLKG